MERYLHYRTILHLVLKYSRVILLFIYSIIILSDGGRVSGIFVQGLTKKNS